MLREGCRRRCESVGNPAKSGLSPKRAQEGRLIWGSVGKDSLNLPSGSCSGEVWELPQCTVLGASRRYPVNVLTASWRVLGARWKLYP